MARCLSRKKPSLSPFQGLRETASQTTQGGARSSLALGYNLSAPSALNNLNLPAPSALKCPDPAGRPVVRYPTTGAPSDLDRMREPRQRPIINPWLQRRNHDAIMSNRYGRRLYSLVLHRVHDWHCQVDDAPRAEGVGKAVSVK